MSSRKIWFFGIFVPIFFIISGTNLDISSIIHDPLHLGLMAAQGFTILRGERRLERPAAA